MSEALQLARQVAAKDLSWTQAVGKDEKYVLAAKATLDAIDAAISSVAPAKASKGIRIPIEADVSSLKSIDPNTLPELRIDLGEGKARVWAETKDLGRIVEMAYELGLGEFATGGIAGADVEPGMVGEQPGGLTDAPLKREWSMFVSSGDDARPIQLGDTVEIRTPIRVVGMSERSTDGHNLGVSKDDGPFCQIEVQGVLTNHVVEILASDLRRCA